MHICTEQNRSFVGEGTPLGTHIHVPLGQQIARDAVEVQVFTGPMHSARLLMQLDAALEAVSGQEQAPQ